MARNNLPAKVKEQNTDLPSTQQKENYSPRITEELRTIAVCNAIDTDVEMLEKYPGKTNLKDLNAVKNVYINYANSCKKSGRYPVFEGLASWLGYSRRGLYTFIENNPNDETTDFLDRIRTAWAGNRQQLAEIGKFSDASSIFILKNSGLGFVDKAEVDLRALQNDNIYGFASSDEIRKKYFVEGLESDPIQVDGELE